MSLIEQFQNSNLTVEERTELITSLISPLEFNQKEKLGSLLRKNGILLNVYENPTPVAVALVTVSTDNGLKLLAVRRNIEPKKGELCMPCGFVDKLENAEKAAAREVWEETGLKLDEKDFTLFTSRVTPANTLLAFCHYAHIIKASDIDMKFISSETQELVLVDQTAQFCFPLHNDVAQEFWSKLETID